MLLCGLTACAPSLAGSQAVGLDADLHPSVSRPLRGETFSLLGSIGSPGRREVRLEQRTSGGTWKESDVAPTRTDGGGGFTFKDVSITSDTRFRISSPGDDPLVSRAVEVASGGTSQAGRIRILPPIAGDITPRPQPASASMALVTATFTPARPGRPVAFEVRRDGAWKAVGTAAQGDDGSATLPARAREDQEWRAVADDANGVAAVTSRSARTPRWTNPVDEEFTRDSQPAGWSHRLSDRWISGRTCGYVTPDQVTFPGQVAQFSTQVVPRLTTPIRGRRASEQSFRRDCKDASGQARYYAGSMMLTGTDAAPRTFTHGIAAARIKFDPRAGQHAAFWLQSNDPNDTEIDVVESFGRDQRPLTVGLHVRRGKDTIPVQHRVAGTAPDSAADDWYENYHVYSVEWTSRAYVYRIDGQEVFRTSRGLSDVPHYVILSNFVADWEIGKNSGERSTMQVDWVKAWQQR